MRTRIKRIIEEIFSRLAAEGRLPSSVVADDHIISVPRQEQHGDYASNFCMVMASSLKTAPRKIAQLLKPELEAQGLFERVEVAGPGFLNFFLSRKFWQQNLLDIKRRGSDYGSSDVGQGIRVLWNL